MILKAVSLTKRLGSDNWYYRRMIPADVQRILHSRAKASRPPGWYRSHISISLRTPDRNMARMRGAEVAANVERLLAGFRGQIASYPAPSVETPAKPTAAPPANKRITALADGWHDAALNRGVRKRDAKRWRAVVVRFVEWLDHDNLRLITTAKVQAWADERSASGVAAKTINDTDIAALRAIFAWGKQRGWLETNPAKEVKIDGRGKATTREKYFLPHEASAILKAALTVAPSSRENPKTTAAKRWVPWLCAYSGARIVEVVQLRKQDIRLEGTCWIIRLSPDAGGIKTNSFRDVPVHDHLIAQGFIEFVKRSDAGALFCETGSDGTTNGPAEGVYNRIRVAVREVVTDPAVQPNHAWRYTFKTYGFEANIDSLTLDAICGHATKTKGQDYTKVTLQTRIKAMASFPRYATC